MNSAIVSEEVTTVTPCENDELVTEDDAEEEEASETSESDEEEEASESDEELKKGIDFVKSLYRTDGPDEIPRKRVCFDDSATKKEEDRHPCYRSNPRCWPGAPRLNELKRARKSMSS